MRRFKFSLAAVKRYRELLEKVARQEFARAKGREKEAEEKLLSLEESLFKAGEMLGESAFPSRSYLAFYLEHLLEERGWQRSFLAEKRKEVALAQENLVAAKREKEVLEKLAEKKWEEYLYARGREEQLIADELALLRRASLRERR